MANKINIYNSSAIYDSMVKDGFLKADKLSKEKFLNALEYNPKYMPRVRAYAQRVYGMSPEDFDNLVYTTDYTQDVSQLPPSGSPDYAPSMPWDSTPAQFSLPYKTKPGSDNNLPGLPAHDNTSQPNFMRDLSPENVTRRALANATPQPMQYIPKEEWDKEISKKEAIQQGLQEIAAHSTRSTTDYSQPISVKSVTHPSDLTVGEWYNSFASDTYSIQKEAGRIYQMWQVGAIDEDEARSRFHQLYVSPQTAQSRNFVRTIDERRNFRSNNAAIDAAEAEITKKLQAAAAQKPTQPIPMPYMGDARISDSIDEQYYKQSLRLLDDARKISRAYADNNHNGTSTAQRVLRGIGDNLITPEAITMGFSAIADNANLMRILEKDERGEQLSDAEETLLSAAIIKQYTEAAYASGTGIAYNIGAVTGESLPYMLSFVATGIPVKAATSGLSKRIVNFVGRQLQRKGIGRAATRATKAALGLGGNIATSALQAPIMPSTYSDYLDRRIGTIDSTTDGMGNISFSHQGDSRSEAALKAYFNTLYQNFGERSGEAISSLWGMFGRGIGKIPIGRGKSINDIFDTIHNSRLGKFWDVMQGTAVADFMRQANYDGVFAEVVEEYISGILNAATIGDQSFEELFSQDNLLTTMGGIALTSVMLGSANATLGVAATQRIRSNFNRSSKAAQQYFSPEQFNQLIGVSGGSVQDITTFLAANIARRQLIARQISQLAARQRNGETGIEAQINTLGAELQDLRMQYDFVNASAMYNAYIGGLSRRIEPMREQARAAIRANGDPATGLTIQVDINGRQGYLIGGNYNHIQDSDGNISVTPTGDLATVLFDGDKTPTPNIPMETISILGVRRTDDVIRDGDRAIFAATEQEENAAQAPATGSTVTVSGSQGNFILQGYDPQGNAIVTPLNTDGTPAVKNGNPITASVPSENIIPEEADNTSSSIRTGSIAYIDGIPYSVDQVDGENAIIHRLNTDGTPINDEQGNPITSIVPTATLSSSPHPAQTVEPQNVPDEQQPTPEQQDAGQDAAIEETNTQQQPAIVDDNITETPSSPLSRIPIDKKGKPIYEQSDPETAYDAILEQAEGDTALASRVILFMIDNKETALNKLSKAKPRRADNPADIIKAEKELAAQIKQAQSDLQFWKNTALVPSLRNEAQKEAEKNSVIQDPSLADTPDITDDSPSDARKRGFRRYAGSRIDRSEPLNTTRGNAAEIRFSAKQVIPVHAAVIEADEIIPSHINGQRNPKHFLDEAQPKERTDQASIMAARQIAAELRPEEITSFTTAYSGAPVINARGEVIQGNNRSAALREMWSSYPEQAARYRQYLIDHAAQLGIDPASIQNMKAPVLVAIADVSDQEAIRLGQYTQTDLESGGTERIKPQNAITAMGNNVKNFANILLQSTDENASLSELLDRNALAALKWMQAKGYITPTQYQSAVDARGNVTAEAKNDLRNILFSMAFKGAAPQLRSMFDNLPARAQRAILTTAYRDMENPEEQSLIPELQNSIRAFHYLMQYPAFAAATNYKDARSAIEAWKRQFAIDDATGDSFLPAENFSNFALLLAASYKGCPQSLIQNIFTGIYDIIQGSRQPNLFETIDNTPKSLQEAINTTIQELLPQEHNFNYNGTTRSNLLAGNSATSQQPRQGSDGTSATGERAEDRNGESDNTGGTESGSGEVEIDESAKEAALSSRVEVLDDDREEYNGEYPTYKRSIIIDGKHTAIQVDEPNEKGEYTGSYFEYDGKRFAGIPEVVYYIDSTPTLAEKVAEAESQVNTNPTEPQKEAGNYRKGHVQIGQFNVSIENPKGSVRSGVDVTGREWTQTMQNTYGYIRGTEGVDGDHIDVFLANDIDGWNGSRVFVIDQYNEDGTFDEHKVMIGFNDEADAYAAYLANYESGWADRRKIVCSSVNMEDFEKWIDSSHRKTKPFTEYKTVAKESKTVGEASTETGPSKTDGYTVERRFHKKNGTYIHAVKFTEQMPRERFMELKKRVKDFGGYYSSFGKGGFIFEDEADAHKFANAVLDESGERLADAAPVSLADTSMASDTLLNAGLPNLPIEMAASRLSDKSMQENHPFDLSEIRNLPKAIQSPMAIFRSATRLGSFVVMTEIEHHGRNFVVAIQANRRKGRIEVNDIRSVYPKNNNQIANWVTEGLLEYVDKKRMVEWLSKQRSNSAEVRKLFNHATNIIQNFDNPKNNNENIRLREMAAEVADAARPAQVTRQIERLAREMNLPIEIIHSIDDIPDEYTRRYIQGEIDGQPHTIAGYYDRTTGKAYIILPAILQTADPLAEAERTILHEVIAHHGMQALMGRDAYDTLCDKVWQSLPSETRARFAAYVLRKNPRDLTITDIARVAASPALRRAAADEYIAALAEGGVENPTLWQRIKAFFRAILRRMHLYSINPTDADIRYLLSQARENLAQTSTESVHRGTDIRLSEKNLSNEEQEIIDRAKADGTYLKAPNGEETNLTPRQWVQVRTQAFKQWFGDWEKAARIEKLRHSEPITVSGNEYQGKYELNSKSAENYLINSLRGKYINKDTGNVINITRASRKVAHHDADNEVHLKSIAYIPQMIENAIFIDEVFNEKGTKFDSYRYYVVGLKIDNVDYTVKLVIGQKNGESYYDHALTEIEKNSLLNLTDGVKADVSDKEAAISFVKDKRLISILQTNASKVVETNGEPLVVYHGSRNFDPLAQEQGRAVFHQGNDGGIHFGTLQQAIIRGGDGNANAFFLNIRNIKRTADRDNHTSIIREAKKEGYDGTVYNNIFEAPGKSFVVFSPYQIKSATSNTGAFSSENPDIRFKIREEEPPKKTGIGYKVFVLKNGKLYPPMVANPEGADTPVGVWLDADAAPVAGQSKTGRNQVKAGGKGTQGGSGKLAYRPGWHLGEIPYALQFNRMDENGNKELFPANFVWAEVEYADDVDYQDEAMSYGMNANGKFQHSLAGLPRVPQNGSYRYRTNPNPETDPWIITGAMRVNRLLTPSEVDYIVKSAGREPQRRQAGAVTDEQINKLNQQLLNRPSDTDIRFRELSVPEETMDNASRQGNDYARDARTHAAASIDTHNPDLSPVEQAEAVRFRELLTRDFSAASDFLNSANLINAAMQANDGKAAWLNNIQEAVFDSMLRLRLLLDRMKKDGASIPAGFNPYLAENQSRSRAQNRIAAFNEDYRRPLIESLAKCINKLREENIGVAIKDNNAAHEALSLYAQARAAVERQEVKEREAREQAKADGTEYKHREWAGLPGIQYAIIALYKGEITDDVEANKNNLQWLQDYAEENNIPTVEQYITMVEDALKKENIDNLWENIRRISEFQLTTSRDAGILSRGSYQLLTYGYNIDEIIETLYKEQRKKITDDINNGIGDKDSLAADLADLDRRHLEAVATATDLDAPDAITTLVAGGWITQDIANDIHRYYNYYLPLKGHAEITGEDLFDYNTPSMPRNASRIKSVRGHEQLARDPFNQILRDAEGCIVQAERNRWKQQLYHVLSTNRSLANGQYAIQRKYYQVIKLDDGTVRYEPYQRVVTTENNEDIITFVPTSEEIAAGTAVLLNSSAKFDIYVSQKQRSEHETIVYIDGSPISILFYDARIAKAVNGTNEAYPPQWMPRAIIQASRTIPALLTSWNPEFVLLSNPIRDTQEAIANAAIDKGFKYTALLARNLATVDRDLWAYTGGKLKQKKDNGQPLSQYEKYVTEFFENGGSVNVTQLSDYETTTKDLKKELKRALKGGTKPSKNFWKRLTEQTELRTRIATYITSRQTGSTIQDAINDAKEITVNFDRRGAQFRNFNLLQMFFNAQMQSVRRQTELMRRHPVRYATTVAILASSKVLIGLGISLLLGGGDDDNTTAEDIIRRYFEINKQLRTRNHIFIIDGEVYRIPVTPAFIPFTTLCEEAAQLAFDPSSRHRNTASQALLSVTSSVLETYVPTLISDPANIMMNVNNAQAWRQSFASGIPMSGRALWQPFIEAIYNYDYTGNPIYTEPQFGAQHLPFHRDYRERTGKAYVYTSKLLSDLTGGNNVIPGKINIHPEQIEHVVQGLAGGIGTLAGRFTGIYKRVQGESAESAGLEFLYDIPFAARLYGGNMQQRENRYYQSLFFDDRQALEAFRAQQRYIESSQDMQDFDKEYNSDTRKYFYDFATADKLAAKVRKWRDAHQKGSPEYKQYEAILQDIYRTTDDAFNRLQQSNDNEPYEIIDNPYYIYNNIESQLDKELYDVNGTFMTIDDAAMAWAARTGKDKKQYYTLSGNLRKIAKIRDEVKEIKKLFKEIGSDYYPGMPLNGRQQYIYRKIEQKTKALSSLYDETEFDNIQLIE